MPDARVVKPTTRAGPGSLDTVAMGKHMLVHMRILVTTTGSRHRAARVVLGRHGAHIRSYPSQQCIADQERTSSRTRGRRKAGLSCDCHRGIVWTVTGRPSPTVVPSTRGPCSLSSRSRCHPRSRSRTSGSIHSVEGSSPPAPTKNKTLSFLNAASRGLAEGPRPLTLELLAISGSAPSP